MSRGFLIVGNLEEHPVRNVKLIKFLSVFEYFTKDLYLVSPTCPSEYKNKIYWKKIKFINKGFFIFRLLNYLISQFKLIFELYKLSDKYKIVIFFLPYSLPIIFSKCLGKKVLRYQAGSISRKNFLKWFLFEKLSIIFSDIIIVQSKSCIKSQYLKKYKRKIMIESFYVDLNTFQYRKPIKERKNICGYFGHLVDSKGVRNLLDAILLLREDIKKKNIKFIFGGIGPLFNYMKTKIKKTNLEKNVFLLGWISKEKISIYLNELKLLVLPSYSEGIPSIILEALASGTPVLTTPVGGIPDIIKNRKTGFLLEDNKPSTIAKKLLECLEHPLLEEISIESQKIVRENFTYTVAIRQFEKILRRVGYL